MAVSGRADSPSETFRARYNALWWVVGVVWLLIGGFNFVCIVSYMLFSRFLFHQSYCFDFSGATTDIK